MVVVYSTGLYPRERPPTFGIMARLPEAYTLELQGKHLLHMLRLSGVKGQQVQIAQALYPLDQKSCRDH